MSFSARFVSTTGSPEPEAFFYCRSFTAANLKRLRRRVLARGNGEAARGRVELLVTPDEHEFARAALERVGCGDIAVSVIPHPEPLPRPRAAPSSRTRRRQDPFGFDPAFRAKVAPIFKFLYHRYWRVETQGVENIPRRGKAILIANHSGAVPFDATMISVAAQFEHRPGRVVRFLYDHFVKDMPLVPRFFSRVGAVEATLDNARALLREGELIGLFPEGTEGVAKGFAKRYELQPFHTGFLRLALEERAPLIPAVVVGAEETYPVIGRIESLGRLLGAPYLPLTPFFPMLGVVGMIPLPTKWKMRFGKPIWPSRRRWGAGPDEGFVRRQCEEIRERMQAMLYELRGSQRSLFF